MILISLVQNKRLGQIVLFVIVAVGIGARLYDVSYNFDGDELASVTLASKPFSSLFVDWPQAAHPPLHILLLHIWMKIFGSSEAAARSLSLLASGLFLFVAHRMLQRLVSDWLALGVLLLLAISPFFVYFGQQARPFSLVALFTALNMLAFMRAFESPSLMKRTAPWFATCVLLIYTQYQAIVLISFECILIFAFLREHRAKLIILAVASIAAVLPWIIITLGPAVTHGDIPLPNISWIRIPTPTEYFWFYVSIFGSFPELRSRWLLVVLVILGLAYIRRKIISKRISADHLLVILGGLGLATFVFIFSVWGPKPVFAYRHLIGAAFATIAFIAICLNTLPQRYAASILLFLLAWTAAALPNNLSHNIKPPWREVAEHIDKTAGNIVVIAPEIWVKGPLEHYRQTGSVSLWDKAENSFPINQEIFLVCRPTHCLDDLERLQTYRKTLIASWKWGESVAETKKLELFKLIKN